ncbi:hypothetical protein COW95_01930 [Candidatus Peregrinibacteria bacterium CG22_combo_CG10-13_8_21_14_all_49_11]|nr:MAG: hypothetical protein COW95_01930 [Candidatus Peregrinibacteria bacterium CG22_combo_CG10-13_8_21_14_all_49_11]
MSPLDRMPEREEEFTPEKIRAGFASCRNWGELGQHMSSIKLALPNQGFTDVDGNVYEKRKIVEIYSEMLDLAKKGLLQNYPDSVFGLREKVLELTRKDQETDETQKLD